MGRGLFLSVYPECGNTTSSEKFEFELSFEGHVVVLSEKTFLSKGYTLYYRTCFLLLCLAEC